VTASAMEHTLINLHEYCFVKHILLAILRQTTLKQMLPPQFQLKILATLLDEMAQ
jgi:hypothetical protein